MIEADIAVVGAGPAGLAAASAAAEAGASVVLVDEYPRVGGQYYRQPPAEFRVDDPARLDAEYTRGEHLFRRARHPRIRVLAETLVWGSFEPGTLEIAQAERLERIRARAIIVCTGAYDRPVAFPGWDLPGVMTAGAAQTLVKHQQVLPGRSILLAGSGPFLLPVAKSLIQAGGRIVAVLEATRPRSWLRHAPGVWGHWRYLKEGWDYLRAIRAARVPLAFGWLVLRAEGDARVERVVVARCDDTWRPVPGTERALAVDALCVGYGFVPAIQLTRLLGCEHVYRPLAGGWVPAHDADMQTSVAGVYVAGEVAGIGGSGAALAEGTLAGLAAAARLGLPVPARQLIAACRARQRARQFGQLLNRLFAPRPALGELITDDVVICRCEEVTAGRIRAILADWTANVNAVKALTRAGMGPCQGRICGGLVADLVARGCGRPLDAVDAFHVRPPIKPLPAGLLARLDQPSSEIPSA